MAELPSPKTLLEAVVAFSDKQVAHDYFVAIRWPNGIACPRMGCGSADVAKIANRNKWRCRDCGDQFTAKVGTVFEDSPIGFDKWLPAMWMLASCRNGISSCELARSIHVTQKTAWFMLHRIRLAMRTETFEKLAGEVEADETYIGGKPKDDGRRRFGRRISPGPNANKTIVMGMVERGGRARAFVVPDTTTKTLLSRLQRHVSPDAKLYTDQHPSYNAASGHFEHEIINHSVEYVRGHVHTNHIEGFWSVFKRTVKGTYIAPRPWHLQRYVEEQVFRFNERRNGEAPRFDLAAKGADGKRIMYKDLIAK